MNRISRLSSAVSSAARSPARSMIGPAVAFSGTPSSAAITCARLVLPTPGGPNSSTWSSASPRLLAASIATLRFAITWGWPTYSSRRRGRSDWSKPRSSSTARAETSRGSMRSAPRQGAQRATQEVLEAPAAVVLERAPDALLGLGARVTEVDQGGDEIVLLGRAGDGGRRGGLRHGQLLRLVLELQDQALGGLLAHTGDAREAGHVGASQRQHQVVRLDAGQDVQRELGAHAGDADQQLEQLLLPAGEEPEQRQRVLPHVRVGQQAR